MATEPRKALGKRGGGHPLDAPAVKPARKKAPASRTASPASKSTGTSRVASEPPVEEESAPAAAGEQPRDPEVVISVRAPESLRRRLKLASVATDTEMQQIVADAVAAWLDHREL